MKVDNYRKKLRTLEDWESFLLKESGLPCKKANLELAQAVAEERAMKSFLSTKRFDLKPSFC